MEHRLPEGSSVVTSNTGFLSRMFTAVDKHLGLTGAALAGATLLGTGCPPKNDTSTGDTGDTSGDTAMTYNPAQYDSDNDGFTPNEGDCDDTNYAVNPGETETCNGMDDDCDGITDENDASDAQTFYIDNDDDGFGSIDKPTKACSEPTAYSVTTEDLATDCNDADPLVNPAATEVCDGADNNCADGVDEDTAADAATFYADTDGDGFGNAAATTKACSVPSGYVADNTDCDDANPTTYPNAPELCDGVSNDCDPEVDKNPVDAPTWYRDDDGDGFGDPARNKTECDDPGLMDGEIYVQDSTDCDDNNNTIHPGATELCNGGVDDDCDGMADESDVNVWHPDTDSDGYGNPDPMLEKEVAACSSNPAGYTLDGTDCLDTNAAINPSATEVCNKLNDDCDGDIDEVDAADAGTWYKDGDVDGFGDAATSTVACEAPSGYVADKTDCDDANKAVNPAATELCDGINNDCDTDTDEDDAADASTWYNDGDADGFGDAATSQQACTAPSGYVADNTDCLDTDPTVNPVATEVCDGKDNDCKDGVDEGAVDASTFHADTDGDGFGDPSTTTLACEAPAGNVLDNTDCDDGNAAVNPAAAELCDGKDNDCKDGVDVGAVDASTFHADTDGDGFGDPSTTTLACEAPAGTVPNAEDCDDANAAVHPGAEEVCNTINDDCSGSVDVGAVDALPWNRDTDGDGYGDPNSSVEACAAPSGYVADSGDCDDSRDTVNPGAEELCGNGLDDNCINGVDDAATAIDSATWYKDSDGDSHGVATVSVNACAEPADYAALADDCDDMSADVNPDASELCNEVDDDCDTSIDEPDAVDALTWYQDSDNDGYGNLTVSADGCEAPSGYVADGMDCDDTDATVGDDRDGDGYDDCAETDAGSDLDALTVCFATFDDTQAEWGVAGSGTLDSLESDMLMYSIDPYIFWDQGDSLVVSVQRDASTPMDLSAGGDLIWAVSNPDSTAVTEFGIAFGGTGAKGEYYQSLSLKITDDGTVIEDMDSDTFYTISYGVGLPFSYYETAPSSTVDLATVRYAYLRTYFPDTLTSSVSGLAVASAYPGLDETCGVWFQK